jgi:hypothetical protein
MSVPEDIEYRSAPSSPDVMFSAAAASVYDATEANVPFEMTPRRFNVESDETLMKSLLAPYHKYTFVAYRVESGL